MVFRSFLFSPLRLIFPLYLILALLLVMPATGLALTETLYCDICGNLISAGQYVQFPDGKTYHQNCFHRAQLCPVCSYPVKKGEAIRTLSSGRVCHQSCLQQTDICDICGEPICPGASYRMIQESGKKYHAACFDQVPKCGLTGLPITPGSGYVRIGNETFQKTEYDKSKKCLVSGLPIVNHGDFLMNPRSKTYVLAAYEKKTRMCYSCGDQLIDGFQVGANLFLCSYCYGNGIKNDQAAQPYVSAVKAFFRDQGAAVPSNVVINLLPPGQMIEKNQPGLKGCCHINCAGENGADASLSYTVELLWGLNPQVFTSVVVHELSHAVIGRALIDRKTCKKPVIHYEEGRCEYTAYVFARSRQLPAYIIEGFSKNQVDNYRKEFLYVQAHPPKSLSVLLTKMDF